MQKNKQKIRLSESLQLGVSDPASQSTLYRTGGIILTVMCLLLAANIVRNLAMAAGSAAPKTLATSQGVPQAVLGAYDQATVASYTIQSGDTLFSIAQLKNVNWEIIAELNNLRAPYTLKAGSVIKFPVEK